MAMDTLKNLAYGVVLLPPTPPNVGTSLTMAAGHSARFPPAPFSVSIWPFGVPADPVNTEIVRVTAKTGDVWTIQRQQENTAARAIMNTDQVAQAMTAKFISDLITDLRAYDTATLASAKAYTDQLRTDMTNAINGAVAPLATKAYVDGQDAIYANDYITRDATVVANANARMDSQDAAYWNGTAKPYVDSRDTAVTNAANAADLAFWNGTSVPFIEARDNTVESRSRYPRCSTVPTTSYCQMNMDTYDMIFLHALAEPITFANPIGVAQEGRLLLIRIRDNGTARALAWGGGFSSITALALPTATVPIKTLLMGFRYNSQYQQWQMVAVTSD